MKNLEIKRENVIKAILDYTHTPGEHIKGIENKSDKELLFHLENFCLICNDDFKEVLKKFECISFDNVTKDNIHLYYEFMSGKGIKKYGYILDDIFDIRLDTLKKMFFDIQFEQLSSDTEYSFNITGLIVFGVKDILKPIDEYIQEIKSSDAYKEYISKKS
jgi:hypothetical protein